MSLNKGGDGDDQSGKSRESESHKEGSAEHPNSRDGTTHLDEDLEDDGSNMPLSQAQQILGNKPASQWQEYDLFGVMSNWRGLTDAEKETIVAQFQSLDADHINDIFAPNRNKDYVLEMIKAAGRESMPPSTRQWFDRQILTLSRASNRGSVKPNLEDLPMGRLSQEWHNDFRSHLAEISDDGIVGRYKELVHKSDAISSKYDDIDTAAHDLGFDLSKNSDYQEFKAMFKPGDDLKEDFDRFVAERDALQPEIEKVQAGLESRRSALQKMVDDYSKKLGIPAPRVEFDPYMNANGSYNSADNVLKIRTSLLAQPDQIARTLAHEMTHAEQSGLMVRNIAEKLNIHENASEADIQRVRQALLDQAGVSMPRDDIATLLRDRTPLSEQEKARAEQLAAGMLDFAILGQHGETSGGRGSSEYMLKSVQRLQKLIDMHAPIQIIADEVRMGAPGLFSGQPVPAYIQSLIDAAKAGDSAAQEQLGAVLKPYTESATKWLSDARFIVYKQRLHEQEAAALAAAIGNIQDGAAQRLLDSIMGNEE